MSKAFLVVGFSNWGKSSIIGQLFLNNYLYKSGYNGTYYTINGLNRKFIVQPSSNDDKNKDKYIETTKKRYIEHSAKIKSKNLMEVSPDLFSTLCPSREPNNDSKAILNDSFFQNNFSDIYLFYLEYKWDYHAKLEIGQIRNYYTGINKVHDIIINADANYPGISDDQKRLNAKVSQIIGQLQLIP